MCILVRRASHWIAQDLPRYGQAAGFLLGTQQVVLWWLVGTEPNLGACTIAAALIMAAQRTASAQQRRNEKRGGDTE